MAITLLEMLRNGGLITEAQGDEALRNRVLFGGKIGTSLIELDFIDEETLARFLSEKLMVPFVNPDHILTIPPDVIALITHDLALKYRVLPIRVTGRKLFLVMSDPSDLNAIDEIAFITGYGIKPLVTPEVRLMQALAHYYGMEVDQRYLRIIATIEERRASAKLSPPQPLLAPAPPQAPPEALLEEAELVTGDDWTERIEHYSIGTVSRELAKAEGREEISDALIRYLGQEFHRVALFAVRGATAYGWRAAVGRFDIEGFDRFTVPLDGPSVMKTVVEGSGIYLGPVADIPGNRRILEALGSVNPAAVLVLPIIVTSRVVALLCVEDSRDILSERTTELQKLLAKTALALEILIFRDHILQI
jgi:MshEN domain